MGKNKVIEYLSKLSESEETILTEKEIISNVNSLKTSKEKWTLNEINELIPFEFKAKYRWKQNEGDWNTYYGPRLIEKNDEPKVLVEYPKLKNINSEILELWEGKAKSSLNPVFSARYADLVIDFSQKITKQPAREEIYKIVIENNIIICQKKFQEGIYCIEKIERALDLAIKINNKEMIENVKNTILELEKNINAPDEKAGLWGFSFSFLLLNDNKAIKIKKEEEQKIIKNMELRLLRVRKNIRLVQIITRYLLEYFDQKAQKIKIDGIFSIYKKVYREKLNETKSALIKSKIYQWVMEICKKFEKSSEIIKTEKLKILKEIQENNEKIANEMTEINLEIPTEKWNAEIKKKFGYSLSIEKHIQKIAWTFLCKKETLKKLMQKDKAKHPLTYYIGLEIFKKIEVCKLNSIYENYDLYLNHFSQNYIASQSLILSLTLDLFKEKFSKEEVYQYFEKSEIFKDIFKEQNPIYFKKALDAFYKNDFLIASYLFMPLIEIGIREITKKCGFPYIKENDKFNGYEYLLMGQLLKNEEMFNHLFKHKGVDFLYYLKLVLTKRLGFNLRNTWAHGWDLNSFFSKYNTSLVFHILLLLTCLEIKK